MSHTIMANIAKKVPTTVEELSELGLAENIEKEYGSRLVKNIKSFVDMEKLEKYMKLKKKSIEKKAKKNVRQSSYHDAIVVDESDEDEFDNGLDFSAISLPSSSTIEHGNGTKSSYFRGAANHSLSKFSYKNN